VTAARSRHVATLLLVGITAIWGSTFFLIRDVVLKMSPADFLAVRFTIAAVAMLAVFWRPMLALSRREIQVGVGLGVLYATAQILQTVGLTHTDASRSGFITGTYVVLNPYPFRSPAARAHPTVDLDCRTHGHRWARDLVHDRFRIRFR
jgi:drug/metabolite transporter (DMT)-like permease